MKFWLTAFMWLFAAGTIFAQYNTVDPWFSLGYTGGYSGHVAQGTTLSGFPSRTLIDMFGSTGGNVISSANHQFGTAVAGMIINVDYSIEPEMISSTGVVNSSTCTNGSNVCIKNTGTINNQAGQFAATIGSASGPISGPTTAYFRYACTTAANPSVMTATNTGRWVAGVYRHHHHDPKHDLDPANPHPGRLSKWNGEICRSSSHRPPDAAHVA